MKRSNINVFGVKKKRREDNSEAIIEILVKNFSKLTRNLKLQILVLQPPLPRHPKTNTKKTTSRHIIEKLF